MENFSLSKFYNHHNFMKDVEEGEILINESERGLVERKVETTKFEIGDKIKSSGKGSVIEGLIGQIIDIEIIGKFLRFKIDWDFESKKKNHYVTFERSCDITML